MLAQEMAAPSNKEMKLTKPALRDGASQLISSVGPTEGLSVLDKPSTNCEA
jgi:hypothetical protein